MSKKKRNTAKKAEAKKVRLEIKRRKMKLAAIVACAVVAVIAIVLICLPEDVGVVFKYKEGAFVDPTTDKVYCPTDTSAYLIKTEVYPKNYYGLMDGDKVYTIPGVKNKDWLVRRLDDELFQLYNEESVTLPDISEFEANGLYLFVDAPLILQRQEVTDKAELDNIVSIIQNGERVEDPGEFIGTYSIRFVSEKYEHMYFCYEYIQTGSGSYFYDHLSFSYIRANGALDRYVSRLMGGSND